MKHRSSDTVRTVFRNLGFGLYEGQATSSPPHFSIGGVYAARRFRTTRPVSKPSIALKDDEGLHVIKNVQFGTEGNVGFFTEDRGLRTVFAPSTKYLGEVLVLVDDLTLVQGITDQHAAALHKLGIFRYEQIGAWTDADVNSFGARLGFTGLIHQRDWVGQARVLQTGSFTGYANDQLRRRKRRK